VFSVSKEGYGALTVAAEQPLNIYSALGITVEPRGGSPGPTGEKVMGGSL
jgi:anti-sigma-K factor RskA